MFRILSFFLNEACSRLLVSGIHNMDSARLGQIYNGEYDEDEKQTGRIWLKLTFNKNDQLVMTFVKDKGRI